MTNKKDRIDTCMWLRAIEAVIEIVFKLGSIYLVYEMGTKIITEPAGQDTLFSILLLPTLLILNF